MIGTRIGGRYTLRSKLAEGGMATLYRGWDAQLEREVAIKLLRPQYGSDPDFIARFGQEARSAGSLTHPNIVSVHDYGTDAGTQFIVMDLVEGRDLASVLRERGRLPVAEAVEIADQVAAGLEAAHRRGIVHRDVKPANILIAPDGHVRVVDFGIARALSQAAHTTTGTTLGSVHYFSPEQARGHDVTPASDVYSLGIVLYEMLTGRRPFEADSAAGIALMRLTDDPPPPTDYDANLPSGLVWLVMRCLAREPEGRFASAGAFRQALRSWNAGEGAAAAAASPISPPVAAAASQPGDDTPTASIEVPPLPDDAAAAAPIADDSAAAAPIAAASVTATAVESDGMPAEAAPLPPLPAHQPERVEPEPPPVVADPEPPQRRHGGAWLAAAIAIVLIALLGGVGYVGAQLVGRNQTSESPMSSIVGVVLDDQTVSLPRLAGMTEDEARATLADAELSVGRVGREASDTIEEGRVIGSDPPSGTELERGDAVDLVISAGPEATRPPTPLETPITTVTPVVEPTAEPVAVEPDAEPAVDEQPPPEPEPAPPASAARDPAQTIALWYELVVDERFDEAYALWSGGMKSRYPRQANLDERWDDTASVNFNELYVAQQSPTYAVVQANFTEVYEGGSSVDRVGYWELVLGDDGWLLEQPHY